MDEKVKPEPFWLNSKFWSTVSGKDCLSVDKVCRCYFILSLPCNPPLIR